MATVQVNDETQGSQGRGDVVVLADGTIVVVWEDFSGRGGDTSNAGIKARLLSAALQPLAPEFTVNTTTTELQNQPAVAARTDGFVVVWTDSSKGRTLPGNGIDADIRAQLFDSSGARVGGEFLVASEMRSESVPAVATLADGGFAIAWQGFPQLGVRTYNADGTPRGSGFADVSPQGVVEIAAYDSGFLVAFRASDGLRVQRFDASGLPVGASYRPVGDVFAPMDVLGLADGRYVLAYGGAGGRATVQVLGADGTPVGSATELVPGDQRVLGATLSPSGDGFAVVVRVGNAGPYELRSRIFDANGVPQDVSTAIDVTPANPGEPALAVTPDGRPLLVFTGGGADGGTEVFAFAALPAGPTPTEGDDRLQGSGLNDVIDGRGGADLIEGFEGEDVLSGSGGDDWLVGGAGNDTLDPGDGVNVLDGGDGEDVASFASRGTGVWADLANGSYSDATTWATYRNLEGLVGSSAADALFGDGGDNVLRGGGGDDALAGRAGADVLEGEDGDDFLTGGEGTDTLRGGAGVDTLSGGAGADLFDLGPACGWDVATDFDAGGGDRIALGFGQAFQYLLVYDANGDGTLDSQLSYAGGTFVAPAVDTLSLADWNALII